MTVWKAISLVLALALLAPAAADAASLDSSFGDGGVLVEPGFAGQRIAQDDDGRVLAAAGSADGLEVVRYAPDGELDASFGVDGIATIPLPAGQDREVTALRLQPDGRILVAGAYTAEPGEGEDSRTFILARLLAGGGTDESFGDFGEAQERPGLIVTKQIDAILIQREKIVVGGEEGRGYVGRFSADGSHDRSFHLSGWAWVPPVKAGSEPANEFTGIAGLLPAYNGSIYATGWAQGKLMVARFSSNGFLVRRFGKRGIVRTRVEPKPSCLCLPATGVARDRRGRLLVVGTAGIGSSPGQETAKPRVVLARYWPNGKLDRRFGHKGIVYAAAGPSTYGNAVAVQPDGRILVAGSAAPGGGQSAASSRVVVFRFLGDGRRDRSFFGNGVFAASFGAYSSEATRALIQPEGQLLIGGSAAFEAPYAESHWGLRGLLARFRLGDY